MTMLINTDVVLARERAEYWADASRVEFHPLHIRADAGRPFSGRMWGDRLGSIGMFRIAATPNTMTRTPGDVAAGDPDSLLVEMVLGGALRGAQRDRSAALKPGDLTAYDTSRPTVVAADRPFDILVLRLAKSELGKQAANISRLTSVRIAGGGGLPRLAARFFFEAATGLADGTIARDDCGLEGHVIDLVRRLYVDLGSLSHPTRPRSAAELLLQAQSEIEKRLGDPSLNPEAVARACFISTRYLHRVFEGEGLSVCGFIRSERLDHCRRDLLDPALADRPIAAIASRWGLPSAAHFSRLFREAYGCSPRDFRRGAGRGTTVIPKARSTPFGSSAGPVEHAEAWARAGWTSSVGTG